MFKDQQLQDLIPNEVFVVFVEDWPYSLDKPSMYDDVCMYNDLFVRVVSVGQNFRNEDIEIYCALEENPEQHIMPSNWDI